jgi:hypothetical protein
MEVFSDNTIKMGTFNQEAIIISGSRTGMGTAFPQAELHISGANNQSLLQVSSPSATSSLFVSGSGNVGIGTATPTNTLNVNGTTFLQGGQTTVRGSGATSTTTALRVENNNATARLTILDDGTSAFNTSHLYVSSSGNVGIGTTSPNARLHISGANNQALLIASSSTAPSALFVSGSGRVGVGTTTPRELLHVAGGNIALDGTRYIDFGSGNSRINDLGLVSGQGYPITISTFGPIAAGASNNLTEKLRLTGSGSLGLGTTSPSARFHISGGFTDGNLMRVQSPTGAEYFFISASGNVGIGTNLPSAELHISGASVDSLLRVGSPTNPDILFVNGNGRVGINTTSSTSFLGGSNISTFTIFQNSGSGDGLTPSTGLQIVNSGSSTSAQAQLSIVTVGDKFASFNIGTSGSGTQNNFWHLSKRNAANGHALNLYNNNNGTFSGPLFSFVSAGTSTLGEYTQIQINDITGRVGLQTTPSDFIHLYSEPGTNYLRIDATSVQAPPVNAASAKNGYGIIANDYFLAEPDYWMEIKLDANVVLIPCYLPA